MLVTNHKRDLAPGILNYALRALGVLVINHKGDRAPGTIDRKIATPKNALITKKIATYTSKWLFSSIAPQAILSTSGTAITPIMLCYVET